MLSFSTATFQVFVAVSAATTAPPTLSFALITANVGHSIVALVEAVAFGRGENHVISFRSRVVMKPPPASKPPTTRCALHRTLCITAKLHLH